LSGQIVSFRLLVVVVVVVVIIIIFAGIVEPSSSSLSSFFSFAMNVNGDSNAVAGPSTIPDSLSPYLPPSGPFILLHLSALPLVANPPFLGPSYPSPYFTSTEDLISRFQLLPAYDKYVRPFVDSSEQDGSADKGKGKERDLSPSPEPISALGNDPEDDDNDKKKKRNSYRHLIKGIPGTFTRFLYSLSSLSCSWLA
jgi:hypothetical protein